MRKEKKVTHPRQVIENWVSWETEYACDGCGRVISRDDHGEGYAHELEMVLDPEECVNFYRRRDYCPACLKPVWDSINALLGAAPDMERDREYD